MDIEKLQSWLAESAIRAAEWRDEKAVEYPNDTRNLECADALRRLSDSLERLPADHPALIAYAAAYDSLDDTVLMSEQEGQIFSRYGFDGAESGDPVAFLNELVEVAHEHSAA